MRKFLALALTAAIAQFGLSVPAQAAPAPDGRQQQLIERVREHLPADFEQRMAEAQRRLGVHDELSDVVRSVLDPADYECAPTELRDWLEASIADWTDVDRLGASFILLANPVMYDALFFPEPPRQRFFGLDGEFTAPVQRAFGGLGRFWDIDAGTIEVLPAHGSTVMDTARVARVLRALLGMTEENAQAAAQGIRDIAALPAYDNGDAPIFTFNAFAYSAQGVPVPGVGLPTDKIVVGDGVLTGLHAIGLGDVAPQAVVGHEFGHHIQYRHDLTGSDLPAPEATRRTELMADSFGSYFLAHRRGAGMRWVRIKHFIETYGNIGDCNFDSPGHHGTPNQRTRAAEWGTLMALLALPPFYRVLPSRTLAAHFDRALPRMVRPDAPLRIELTLEEKAAA